MILIALRYWARSRFLADTRSRRHDQALKVASPDANRPTAYTHRLQPAGVDPSPHRGLADAEQARSLRDRAEFALRSIHLFAFIIARLSEVGVEATGLPPPHERWTARRVEGDEE